MNEIRTVAVIGGGQMGSGIAVACVLAGMTTTVREVTEVVCQRALAAVTRSTTRLVERGLIEAERRDAALARLRCTTELEAIAGSDLVIEAVVEDLSVKTGLWTELDALCRPGAIFASNTSSLTIAAMAAATARPDRMIGLHFFHPVLACAR